MSDSWDDYAADWDTSPDVIAYSERAYQCLLRVEGLQCGDVFDFGCGTGLLTQRISPNANAVVALDSSQKMIDVLAAKNLPNVVPICGTLAELLTPENGHYRSRFDLAVASSVCAFVPDYEEVLHQLKALLRVGGMLVQWDWLSTQESGGSGFTEAQVLDALARVGFRSVSVSTPFSMPGPEGSTAVLMAIGRR